MIMHKKPISIPRYTRRNSHNEFDKLIALLSLGIISYTAYVNTINLDYNKRGAQSTERIAHELRCINNSHFMHKLNGELDKER